jgi:hypothetical protein
MSVLFAWVQRLRNSYVAIFALVFVVFFLFWIFFGRDYTHEVDVGQTSSQRMSPEEEIVLDDSEEEPEPIFEQPLPVANNRKRSKGEQLTQKALEQLLGRSVMSQYRPDFLTNPESGRPLELDCYDPVEGLAVEYNGKQHYVYNDNSHYYHRNLEAFQDQIYRDELKWRLCNENQIYLIVIPYTVDMCTNMDQTRCSSSVSEERRYQRIYQFLETQLQEFYQRKMDDNLF